MAPPPRPPPPPPPAPPVADPVQMKGKNDLDISPLAGSERIGGRQRDKSSVYAAESEALDQIAKEAEARLAARRKARYEARNIRLKELEKKKEAEANAENIANTNGTNHTTTTSSNINTTVTPNINTTNNVHHHTPAATNHLNKSAHTEGVRLRATRGGSADPRTFSSRRSSTDSSEDGFNLNVRDLKNELKELEEKFRKAMVANAGLDNEKSALNYQVELLKDQMEEVEEQASLVTKELREKNRDYELLKRSHAETQRAVQLLQAQLDEQARLLAERGMVLVGNEDEETTCEAEDRANANGALNYEEQEKRTRAIVSSETASILGALGLKGQPLDVRIRKLADERDDLGDTVRRLKMDLEEEKARNSRLEKMAPHQMSAEETEWETKKAMDDYKFKLQKSEQDINTLQTNVARLESQVIRFKTAAETAERSEEELKTERRKMQRELREATTRVEELETANKHLETRLGKLKTAKSTLLKEL